MALIDKFGDAESRDFGEFIGNTSEPMIYNLNISGLPDGNCVYELNYYSSMDDACSWISTVSYLSIDNDPVAPIWNSFKNENSTNLSQYNTPPDYWTKIPNVYLYHPLYGSIDFSKSICSTDSLLCLAPKSAASLQRFSRSAPEKPGV